MPRKALIFAPAVSLCGHSRSDSLDDLIAKMQKRLDDGRLRLDYDRKQSYLKSIIDALGVPLSSQTLVFSKTSFQGLKVRRPGNR